MRKKLGISCLIVGVGLIASVAWWRINGGKQVSFAVSEPVADRVERMGVRPVKLTIEVLGMELGIEEAGIVNGEWQVSDKGATHWDGSANLGTGENVVLYGHNKNSALGPIRWLKLGDEIVVTGKDEQSYRYSVKELVTVSPSQVEYILPQGKEVLTIYTCTGLFDKDRFVVRAEPVI